MNSRHIKHISSSLYKKLHQHINKIAVHFDTEDIHQFRITYKKLRAFFRMLSLQNNIEKAITPSKKLKKVYTLLGTIRDLQLQQQRTIASNKNLKKIAPYINLLQQQIDKLKPELLNLVKEKPVAKSKNKIAAKLPEKISPEGFKKFAQQKWQAIHHILATGNFSDENIHTIRKLLKDLLYNLKADEAFDKQLSAMHIWKGKDAAYFADLLDELGIFQDKCTAVTLLKTGWLNQLNKPGQEQTKFLKKIWTAEKLHIKQALVKKLKVIFIILPPAN